MTDSTVPAKIQSVWPALLLLVLSVGYVAWAQRYGETARLMPTVTGTATAVLAVIDLLSRLQNKAGSVLRVALGADFKNREMGHDPDPRRELAMMSWMLGCILLLLVIGFLPTIPVFIAAFMRLWGRRPWIPSILSAVIVLIFVILVFEVVLDYGLYRGWLFEGGA